MSELSPQSVEQEGREVIGEYLVLFRIATRTIVLTDTFKAVRYKTL